METMKPKVNVMDKLELARELNLKEQLSMLEYKTGMFDLKFREISSFEIAKRLTKVKWRLRPSKESLFALLILVVCGFGIHNGLTNQELVPLAIAGFVFGLLALFTLVVTVIQFCEVRHCWVDNFQHEIPYGGMLALKEAGEKGIVEHRVWYPTWENVMKINDDPIITGINKYGKMVEIYAWNEDDVYEENL